MRIWHEYRQAYRRVREHTLRRLFEFLNPIGPDGRKNDGHDCGEEENKKDKARNAEGTCFARCLVVDCYVFYTTER